MTITDDPKHPGINKPSAPGEQNEAYLVLSDEERAKGFERPVRGSYLHLNCGTVTTMAAKIAETFARNRYFYSDTWCSECRGHFPVRQFHWLDGSDLGT